MDLPLILPPPPKKKVLEVLISSLSLLYSARCFMPLNNAYPTSYTVSKSVWVLLLLNYAHRHHQYH